MNANAELINREMKRACEKMGVEIDALTDDQINDYTRSMTRMHTAMRRKEYVTANNWLTTAKATLITSTATPKK